MSKSNAIKKNVLKDSSPKKEKQKGKNLSTPSKQKKGPSLLKDERFILITGVLLIIIALYLTTSFTSYLWNYLVVGAGIQNAAGYFGQKIGEFFITLSFGIGAYAFALWALLTGIKRTFKNRPIKTYRIITHSLFWLCWLPITMSLLFHTEPWMILGGSLGLYLKELLIKAIGKPFLIVLLLFLLFTYLIMGLNIHKIFLSLKRREREEEEEDKERSEKETSGSPLPKEDLYNTHEFAVREEDEEPEKEDLPLSGSIELEMPPMKEPQEKKEEEEQEITLSVEEIKKEETIKRPDRQSHYHIESEYDPRLDLPDFIFPKADFLVKYDKEDVSINKQELEENKNNIVSTLNNYAISIEHIKATVGPTITLYEIIPAPGIRISKIKNLEDDIALSLSALGIRIIAPIPGKGTIGIEVPNQKPQIVSMRSIINSARFQESKFQLPIGLGKTIANESFVADLTKMPHLLIAGATGQGKSVGLNAILTSLLYKKHPSELKLVLVDPKKVELTLFNRIERHYLAKLPDSEEAIITDTRKVVRTLNSLLIEMDNRYNLLKDAQVRNIKEYNERFIKRRLNPNEGHRYLPYIVLIVDEFADLIMTAGKEVEAPITRLAQLARAIGIHLIIATQRPSVNIITGTIKANFPARIAFRVVSKMDSRTILDSGGADQLVGRGDMLLSTGSEITRLQCAFVDTPEVEEITDFIGTQRGYPEAFALPEVPDEEGSESPEFDSSERDPLFEEAAQIIVMNQQGSTSLLQRKLKLGYNRAGRIMDQLELAGIVGPSEGSKAREVRVGSEMALEQFLKDLYAREGEKENPPLF
ncbi:MAG: cell division protein FtsK [Bacteroidetes bacterium]|nr:MAG: cell division protein FtsK [Bacteroidota bacterium]PIE87674.1 MAG: cell division protein FtsK [Bacteroidota bacterium]